MLAVGAKVETLRSPRLRVVKDRSILGVVRSGELSHANRTWGQRVRWAHFRRRTWRQYSPARTRVGGIRTANECYRPIHGAAVEKAKAFDVSLTAERAPARWQIDPLPSRS